MRNTFPHIFLTTLKECIFQWSFISGIAQVLFLETFCFTVIFTTKIKIVSGCVEVDPSANGETFYKGPYIFFLVWSMGKGREGGAFLFMRKMKQIGLTPRCHKDVNSSHNIHLLSNKQVMSSKCNFSPWHPHIIQQTGNEYTQTYQVEVVILI